MSNISRESLIQVINNIDVNKLKHDIIRVAFDKLNDKEKKYTIFAFLSSKTGELEYKTDEFLNNKDYILLSKYEIKPFYLDYEPEDILDGDALNEFLSLIEDESSEFFEEKEYALEYILDNYGLDKRELEIEHFISSNLDNIKVQDLNTIINSI